MNTTAQKSLLSATQPTPPNMPWVNARLLAYLTIRHKKKWQPWFFLFFWALQMSLAAQAGATLASALVLGLLGSVAAQLWIVATSARYRKHVQQWGRVDADRLVKVEYPTIYERLEENAQKAAERGAVTHILDRGRFSTECQKVRKVLNEGSAVRDTLLPWATGFTAVSAVGISMISALPFALAWAMPLLFWVGAVTGWVTVYGLRKASILATHHSAGLLILRRTYRYEETQLSLRDGLAGSPLVQAIFDVLAEQAPAPKTVGGSSKRTRSQTTRGDRLFDGALFGSFPGDSNKPN